MISLEEEAEDTSLPSLSSILLGIPTGWTQQEREDEEFTDVVQIGHLLRAESKGEEVRKWQSEEIWQVNFFSQEWFLNYFLNDSFGSY